MYPTIPYNPKYFEVFLAIFSSLSEHSSIICDNADCSIGKKGPISVPVTEITPMIPAITKTMRFDEYA